jgi:rhamnose utilization protein RhaD (predicted bifunctional aldolase and dehydrogenase)
MDALLEQLLAMTHYLGDPSRDYAMLGEGNTSVRIDDDSFYVKASGHTMANIGPDGFVRVSMPRIMDLLEDPAAGDDDVARVYQKALLDDPEGPRPSVEALLHAILLQIPEFRFVGHTHPVYTNSILCSVHAEEAFAGRIFPDQIVSMKHRSVFVPYVDPGLVLAREVKTCLEHFIEDEGVLPAAILMQNHGLITMGDSPKAVTSCTDMTEKSARILVGAYAAGGPRFLEEHHVNRIFTRPDEHYRLRSIAGRTS